MIKERTELTLPSSPTQSFPTLSAFGRGKGVGLNFLNQPVTPAPAQQRPVGLPLSRGRTLYRVLVYSHPTPSHTGIRVLSHSNQVQLSAVGPCSQKTPLFHKREGVRHMVQPASRVLDRTQKHRSHASSGVHICKAPHSMTGTSLGCPLCWESAPSSRQPPPITKMNP